MLGRWPHVWCVRITLELLSLCAASRMWVRHPVRSVRKRLCILCFPPKFHNLPSRGDNTEHLVRFYKKKFDELEILCKLDSTDHLIKICIQILSKLELFRTKSATPYNVKQFDENKVGWGTFRTNADSPRLSGI